MIVVIDYRMGNLLSVSKAVEKVGFKAVVTSKAADIKKSDAIILPGVGAFSHAMENLKKLGIIELIKDEAKKRKPFLGICLGLQLLFTESKEGGIFKGLDLVSGCVKKLTGNLKIPQMGWNRVKFGSQKSEVRGQILKGIPDNSYFYFAHSYYAAPEDKKVIVGTTTYGREFAVFVRKGNVYGMQFHPEKSGDLGLKILKNFCESI